MRLLKSGSRASAEQAARRGRRQQNDVGPPQAQSVPRGERRRLLHRFEVDERRLVVECRLEQIHLGLK